MIFVCFCQDAVTSADTHLRVTVKIHYILTNDVHYQGQVLFGEKYAGIGRRLFKQMTGYVQG